MLTIFRRHLKSCPHTSRSRCRCPLHVEGTLAGEPIRKALDLSSWEAAQNLVREWEATGRITRQPSPSQTPLKNTSRTLVRDSARERCSSISGSFEATSCRGAP